MSKRTKIIYWIATLWLSLGMVSTGAVQLLKPETQTVITGDLGYPAYVLTLLGVLKILGVIVVLMPGVQLLKEWAYAGFFFAMSGAVVSHLAVSHPFSAIAPSLLLLTLTILSWYFRPAERRLVSIAK